jgi:hypothetical protein
VGVRPSAGPWLYVGGRLVPTCNGCAATLMNSLEQSEFKGESAVEAQCRQEMARALAEFGVQGPQRGLPCLRDTLCHAHFAQWCNTREVSIGTGRLLSASPSEEALRGSWEDAHESLEASRTGRLRAEEQLWAKEEAAAGDGSLSGDGSSSASYQQSIGEESPASGSRARGPDEGAYDASDEVISAMQGQPTPLASAPPSPPQRHCLTSPRRMRSWVWIPSRC